MQVTKAQLRDMLKKAKYVKFIEDEVVPQVFFILFTLFWLGCGIAGAAEAIIKHCYQGSVAFFVLTLPAFIPGITAYVLIDTMRENVQSRIEQSKLKLRRSQIRVMRLKQIMRVIQPNKNNVDVQIRVTRLDLNRRIQSRIAQRKQFKRDAKSHIAQLKQNKERAQRLIESFNRHSR